MDAAQWSQHQVASLAKPMEEITSTPPPPNHNNSTNQRVATQALERRTRPQKDQVINCPRCNSTNTKFCYYNNYSLTQPRYFCKTCRRYWTQGGSLRNVPVGGGSRKNKRSSSSSPSILTSSSTPSSTITTSTIHHNKLIPDLNPPTSLSHLLTQNPNKFLEGQDLNLAFPIQGIFHHIDQHQLPKMEGNNNNNENHEPPINMNGNLSTNSCTTTTTSTTSCGGGGGGANGPISALELLRTGIASRGSLLNPYLPMPIPDSSHTLYQSGFPHHLQEFKSNMNVFTSPNDHHEHNSMVGSGDNNNKNSASGNNNGGARLLFPFADMNKLATSTTPTTTQHHHDHHHDHHHQIDDQSNKVGSNDHHNHHHHHQGPTPGYWSGMLGGGTW